MIQTAVFPGRYLQGAAARFLAAGMGDALATWFEAESCRRSYSANQCSGLATLAIGVLAGLFLSDQPKALIEDVYEFCESIGLPTTGRSTRSKI